MNDVKKFLWYTTSYEKMEFPVTMYNIQQPVMNIVWAQVKIHITREMKETRVHSRVSVL